VLLREPARFMLQEHLGHAVSLQPVEIQPPYVYCVSKLLID
jgi:hypothetical protein